MSVICLVICPIMNIDNPIRYPMLPTWSGYSDVTGHPNLPQVKLVKGRAVSPNPPL